MLKRFCLIFAVFGALEAQQVAAPTPEQVGSPRGDNLGGYNVTQSFETGYRWSRIGGDFGEYRSDVNYGNGIRLLGSSLALESKDGHGRLFDEILLNTSGLGNDPYQSSVLRIQKNGLYRYDMTWRLNDYYNPGLTVAGNEHLADTARRLQDHDLTLLPQSRVRFRVGYSRDTETGPALSSVQEFDPNGAGYPVFTNVRREWNEYRLGGDVDLAGFKFSVMRRWDFFKDDSPFAANGVVASRLANDLTVLQQFQRSQPAHGSNPGWLGNLYTRRTRWGLNARMAYVSGQQDFLLSESALGTGQFGNAASRQVAVGGNARRPDLAGDFSVSLFPSDRLTVVNNTSVSSNRIDGQSSYSEVNTGLDLGTTIRFRYLGIRTVTNSTDVDYRVANWIGFYAGYHYSDRLVRTVEIPSFTNLSQNADYRVTNILNSGVAGVRLRPLKPLTINLDGEVGRSNQPLTPISLRAYHSIGGRVAYRVRKLQLSTAYRELYDVNSEFSVFSSHSRNYSAGASWAPRDWFTVDASYARQHFDSLSLLAFFAGVNRPQLQASFRSLYVSNVHAANLATRFSIHKRVDVFVGYSITKDTGDGRATAAPSGVTDPIQALLSSVQTFPLTYQSPLARVSVRITPKIRWNAGWQFYDYGETFQLFATYQNFHAHTGFTSVLWSF